jgi:MFS family permease
METTGTTGAAQKGRNSGFAWLILVVTYIASVAATICMFKMPPLAHWIIPEYHLDGATFGWLMGLMSVVGIVLAFPTAWIIKKIGLKGTILVAVGTLIAGSLLEILGGGITLLFVGRVIEGTGIGLLGVAASTAVTVWFTPDKRGLPLSIWATWFPVGTLLMMNFGPILGEIFGWKTVWIGALVFCVVAFLLFLFVFRMPTDANKDEVVVTAKASEMFKVIKNKNIWMLGIIFFCFNYYVLGVVNSFYNQYLEGIWGLPPTLAAPLVSIATLIGLVAMPTFGAVSDKAGKRKVFLIVGAVVLLASGLLAFTGITELWFFFVFIALTGLGLSMVSSVARPMAPEVMPATALGATMGMVVMQFTQQLASTFGSPVFGMLLESQGGVLSQGAWAIAGYATVIPILIINLIAALLIKSR